MIGHWREVCCTDNPAEARFCRHCGKALMGESPLRPAVAVMQDLSVTTANGRTLTTHGPVTETWETGDRPPVSLDLREPRRRGLTLDQRGMLAAFVAAAVLVLIAFLL